MSNTLEERIKRRVERNEEHINRLDQRHAIGMLWLGGFSMAVFAVGDVVNWLFLGGAVPALREFFWGAGVWFVLSAVGLAADSRRTRVRDERLVRIEVQVESLVTTLEILQQSQQRYVQELHEDQRDLMEAIRELRRLEV